MFILYYDNKNLPLASNYFIYILLFTVLHTVDQNDILNDIHFYI